MEKEKTAAKKERMPARPGVLTPANIDTLAEMYSGIEEWKNYTNEQKEGARKIILGMIEALSKIGFEPRPFGEHRASREKKGLLQNELQNYLKQWIIKYVTVPRDLVGVFPYPELAAHLIRDFKIEKEI